MADDSRPRLLNEDFTPLPRINVNTLQQMYYIVANSTEEVAFYAHLDVNEKEGTWEVTGDVHVPNQDVHPTEALISPEREALMREVILDADGDINDLRVHGHSHVNMGVTPSGDDEKTVRELLKSYVTGKFVRIILNKKHEIRFDCIDLDKELIWEGLNPTICLPKATSTRLDAELKGVNSVSNQNKPIYGRQQNYNYNYNNNKVTSGMKKTMYSMTENNTPAHSQEDLTEAFTVLFTYVGTIPKNTDWMADLLSTGFYLNSLIQATAIATWLGLSSEVFDLDLIFEEVNPSDAELWELLEALNALQESLFSLKVTSLHLTGVVLYEAITKEVFDIITTYLEHYMPDISEDVARSAQRYVGRASPSMNFIKLMAKGYKSKLSPANITKAFQKEGSEPAEDNKLFELVAKAMEVKGSWLEVRDAVAAAETVTELRALPDNLNPAYVFWLGFVIGFVSSSDYEDLIEVIEKSASACLDQSEKRAGHSNLSSLSLYMRNIGPPRGFIGFFDLAVSTGKEVAKVYYATDDNLFYDPALKSREAFVLSIDSALIRKIVSKKASNPLVRLLQDAELPIESPLDLLRIFPKTKVALPINFNLDN